MLSKICLNYVYIQVQSFVGFEYVLGWFVVLKSGGAGDAKASGLDLKRISDTLYAITTVHRSYLLSTHVSKKCADYAFLSHRIFLASI